MDAALLLAIALCIPRKSVLNSVRKHFKDLGDNVTCSKFISELQKPKNKFLIIELGLHCDVPDVRQYKEVSEERRRRNSIKTEDKKQTWIDRHGIKSDIPMFGR